MLFMARLEIGIKAELVLSIGKQWKRGQVERGSGGKGGGGKGVSPHIVANRD